MTSVTTGQALAALEEANLDTLEDVLKHINFNRKIGQRTLDDDTLADFIQNFEKIPLRDENFDARCPVHPPHVARGHRAASRAFSGPASTRSCSDWVSRTKSRKART